MVAVQSRTVTWVALVQRGRTCGLCLGTVPVVGLRLLRRLCRLLRFLRRFLRWLLRRFLGLLRLLGRLLLRRLLRRLRSCRSRR